MLPFSTKTCYEPVPLSLQVRCQADYALIATGVQNAVVCCCAPRNLGSVNVLTGLVTGDARVDTRINFAIYL